VIWAVKAPTSRRHPAAIIHDEVQCNAKVAAASSVDYFIEELKSRHDIHIDDGTARGFLGSFSLQGRVATNPIYTLSGGQKVCRLLGWIYAALMCEIRSD
jgi:ATPase subunit of ABC transporter with duplicated ATPase domains